MTDEIADSTSALSVAQETQYCGPFCEPPIAGPEVRPTLQADVTGSRRPMAIVIIKSATLRRLQRGLPLLVLFKMVGNQGKAGVVAGREVGLVAGDEDGEVLRG